MAEDAEKAQAGKATAEAQRAEDGAEDGAEDRIYVPVRYLDDGPLLVLKSASSAESADERSRDRDDDWKAAGLALGVIGLYIVGCVLYVAWFVRLMLAHPVRWTWG